MFKKLGLPCLLLVGLFAAVAETEKSAPKKVGWVETHRGLGPWSGGSKF